MNSKKPLVFLHGWGATSRTFAPLFHYLKNNFNIYTFDLPGFGSAPIDKTMTLKDYAEFINNFLKINNIKNPVIVGHSFGGAVAVKLALLYPHSISKLILVGAAAIRQPNIKIKIIRKISGFFSRFFPQKIKAVILKILNIEQSDYTAIKNHFLKETFKNVINEDLGPFLPEITIPTLIIWGEKDMETPLGDGKLIAKSIPGAKIEIIKNAGHFTFLDEPQEFIKLIKEFIL